MGYTILYLLCRKAEVLAPALWKLLVEYAVHRLVYHHAPVFSVLHDSHHRVPNAGPGRAAQEAAGREAERKGQT
jgi:sterol desaturase/sphingolipid hydroxylase (fatty acid hydroxylase superfamily)